MSKDRIYSHSHIDVADFVFDEAVVDVFPDMIERSVPGYPAIINMIELLTRRHVKPSTRLYDLGCSRGAATMAMDAGVGVPGCEIIAIDNSSAMIEKATSDICLKNAHLSLECSDIRDTEINNASIIVMNFTLQFVPLADRLDLLRKARNGLCEGGVLVLSEKIMGKDQVANDLLVDMHHTFKTSNGYSDLEVSQKRSALENVLIPETYQQHEERLLEAGFSRVDKWFQCFNFVSLVAQA